jgi:hypothetical protein
MEYVLKEDLIELLFQNGDLKREYGFKKVDPIKASHGSCCCCIECGQHHDECVCTHNEWIENIDKITRKGEPNGTD